MKRVGKIFIFTHLLLCISCGQVTGYLTPLTMGTEGVVVDSKVQKYFDSFMYEAKKRNVNINPNGLIILVSEPPHEYQRDSNALGTCFQTHKTIFIRERLLKMPEIKIEMLLFHELGHCLIGREHTEEPFASIMYPVIPEAPFAENYYPELRDKFLDELFGLTNFVDGLPF